MDNKYLTSGEAIKILHVNEKTLRNWEKSGKLVPHHKSASGYKYYTRKQLHDFNKQRYNETHEDKFEDFQEVIDESTKSEENVSGDDISNAPSNEVIEMIPKTQQPLLSNAEYKIATEQIDSKTAVEIQKNAVPAEYHYFSTAKPVRRLTEIGVNQSVTIPMGKTGYVKVTLISGDVENPKEEHPTLLDIALIEGVVSLKKAGNEAFSVSQLVRHLNGNSRNGCTDEKIAEVTKRLRKMMEWRIKIDARPEFEHYKNLPENVVEKAVFEGHLLYIIYLETTNWRGEKTIMFGFPVNNLFRIPEDRNVSITHESYSDAVGKLTCFQTDLLDIKGVRKTQQNNLIANYLLQRIQGMKNKNNRLEIHTIKFETLQKVCGLQNCSKQQMYVIREAIVKMLDFWKEKGHIKDYKFVKAIGGAYHSISIELPEVKKKNVRNGTGRGNKVHPRKSASVS